MFLLFADDISKSPLGVIDIIGYYLLVSLAIAGFVALVVSTLYVVARPRDKKTGRDRRKAVAVIWIFLLLLFVFRLIQIKVEDKHSNAFRSNLDVSYAQTYNYPVILPTGSDYKIDFDGKWAQLEVFMPNNTMFIQVPMTTAREKYFNPASGPCDFDTMREDNPTDQITSETCTSAGDANGFQVYVSSKRNAYLLQNGIAGQLNLPGLGGDMAARGTAAKAFAATLVVTDKNALVQALNSSKFTGAYSEVLDSWHKEGKF